MNTLKEIQEKYPQCFATREEGSCGFGCGDGWVRLIELVIRQTNVIQPSTYLKLLVPEKDGRTHRYTPFPFFDFKFQQIKEKFGRLTMYYNVKKVEHDWTVFDREEYNSLFELKRAELRGFVDCLEVWSTTICEVCGEKGEIKDCNGWQRCVCNEHEKI